MPEATEKTRSALVKAGILALLALGLYLGYQAADLPWNTEKEGVLENLETLGVYIDSLGPLGPAVFVAASAAAIMVYVPAAVIVCVAVCLFGGVAGALLAAASIYLAVSAVYLIARVLGRDLVARVKSRRFRNFESRLANNGLKSVVYLRLLFFVFPPTNWLLGLSVLKFRDVLFGTILGTLHHIIVFAWITDALADALRAGRPLHPLENRHLLIPILVGAFLFVALHTLSRCLRHSGMPSSINSRKNPRPPE